MKNMLIQLKGDFRGAIINLAYNELTRFEEGVFKEMLTQMASSSGSLDVTWSKFIGCQKYCFNGFMILQIF